MTREEFLAALRQELVNVSEEERDEALKFYNEFLDEAGPDQEQKVIEELGTPHRVANIIRANLGLTGIAGVQDGAASAPPQPQPSVQEEAAVQKEEAVQEETAAPEPQPAKAVPQLTLEGPDSVSYTHLFVVVFTLSKLIGVLERRLRKSVTR